MRSAVVRRPPIPGSCSDYGAGRNRLALTLNDSRVELSWGGLAAGRYYVELPIRPARRGGDLAGAPRACQRVHLRPSLPDVPRTLEGLKVSQRFLRPYLD